MTYFIEKHVDVVIIIIIIIILIIKINKLI